MITAPNDLASEARKFYASRLPHDWWTRVIARSNWAPNFRIVTTGAAFPISSVQILPASPFRVAVLLNGNASSQGVFSNQPFTFSAAFTANAPIVLSNSNAFSVPYTLLQIGRAIQLPWHGTFNNTTVTGTLSAWELVCDIDPFDFDAIYKD